MWRATLKPGDPVIYTMPKQSTAPGPRAQNIVPAPRGDTYVYHVEKFWVVDEVRDDGKVLLRTRRGKSHLIDMNDPRLRRPRWWERLLYRHRFPSPQKPVTPE